MGRVTVRRRVLRVREGDASYRPDTLAAEEPMEIRVGGRPLTVTMRTPGDDFDLAVGFLVSEGVVHSAEDVAGIRYCAGATADGGNTYNVVDVGLAPGVAAPDASLERNFYTTSSCGLCGKASLDAVRTTAAWSVAEDPLRIGADVLAALPDRLRAAQRVFDSTGGLHAAGLFTAEGELVCLREDVGRHNAVDKVVGHALREGLLPLRAYVLMVSGRASFELVQKAVMAGIPLLAAVSAPSSLAVDLAAESGLTLVGFLRGSSMNVYTGDERLSPLPVA
ncbi:formate dehydrogenase accessory sulfurtransferase FdhD [Streptomyces sp. NPDC087908]|uniref:formate dehydrogenase accessory sulfurtransferase FdhD n=1 Tax=unclassified Streptomyces TaxID=2593676 RepID=UPI0011CEAA43|nr:formate dehydrogenase accessory sulfurtransferase FdhD [Streptomyces sp. adm13(2018)]TXS12156.1 formate dehydrogenase accessory sulfurtransferase FdhD [Streptomyces sp. adm13(2018)]